jgi:broad specificity phosphatase PhoE
MILMRHAETVFNVVYGATRRDPGVHDPSLTADGHAQAHHAAAALGATSIRRVIASPYRRTLQTADIIARALGVPVTVEPLIRERAAFACDIGTPKSKLARDWSAYEFHHLDEVWWADIEEPERSLQERCHRFCANIARMPDWPHIAVITHWGVIKALTGLRVKNCEGVRFDPTAPVPDGNPCIVVSPGDTC